MPRGQSVHTCKTASNPTGRAVMSRSESSRTSLTGLSGGSAALYAYSYQYDAGGNVKKIAETYPDASKNRVVTNAYDAINRLTSEAVTGSGAETTTFAYDDAHNRESMTKGATSTAYTYNVGNQLTGFTEGNRTASFAYDDNGNRATRTEGAAADASA